MQYEQPQESSKLLTIILSIIAIAVCAVLGFLVANTFLNSNILGGSTKTSSSKTTTPATVVSTTSQSQKTATSSSTNVSTSVTQASVIKTILSNLSEIRNNKSYFDFKLCENNLCKHYLVEAALVANKGFKLNDQFNLNINDIGNKLGATTGNEYYEVKSTAVISPIVIATSNTTTAVAQTNCTYTYGNLSGNYIAPKGVACGLQKFELGNGVMVDMNGIAPTALGAKQNDWGLNGELKTIQFHYTGNVSDVVSGSSNGYPIIIFSSTEKDGAKVTEAYWNSRKTIVSDFLKNVKKITSASSVSSSSVSSTSTSTSSASTLSSTTVANSGDIKVFMYKNISDTDPMFVTRSESSTDKVDRLSRALIELMKGPNATESTQGYLRTWKPTGLSTCQSNWWVYIMDATSMTATVKICNDQPRTGSGDDMRLQKTIANTVKQFGYSELILKDKDNNCFFNASGNNTNCKVTL